MIAKPRLQSLIFEVTQRCNHTCRHCYNVWQGEPVPGQPAYPRGELDTGQTLGLLAKALDETECRHVTLTGGEPLLRKDLPAILEFLSARRVHITLISNGRLLDEKTIISLLEHGVGTFELPLLSREREMHDWLSGAPGAWDAVLSAMADIRLHAGQVVAAFVATRQNISHLHETIRLAFAFGARAVMLNRFNPGGRGRLHMQDLLPSVEQVRDALRVAEAASQKLRISIACSIPIQPCLIDTQEFPRVGFGYCAAGTDRAYYTLDPLGNVRPCNHSPLILGNLFEHTFSELVASENLAGFVASTPIACSNCDKLRICQGGCKAAAQQCYGSLALEEPFLADARRMISPGPVG